VIDEVENPQKTATGTRPPPLAIEASMASITASPAHASAQPTKGSPPSRTARAMSARIAA
jgi:hypothetical protein